MTRQDDLELIGLALGEDLLYDEAGEFRREPLTMPFEIDAEEFSP